MINLLGLKNVVKPTNISQNSSTQAFRFANFAQKPDCFERTNAVTSPINFTGKSNRLKEYKKLTSDLNTTAQNAQEALDKQLATEGWSGKTADAISVLWNSKNRAKFVQADINEYKSQVSELDASIKKDKFTDKFKEMFEVEYNHSNIAKYGRKAKQLEIALATDCIANYTDEKLSKNVQIFKKNTGELKDLNELKINTLAPSGSIPYYNHLTTKEEIFENMENSLVEVLGDKKILDKILSSNGLDSKKASNEDKYKMYGNLSSFILESSQASANSVLKGQTLAQVKEDYDKSYEKAFGTKNDIIKRVDKYNASQKAGAACIRFVSNVILNTLGPSSVLASCAYSAGKSVFFDIANTKTKDVDKDIDIKKLLVNAGLSGVSGIVNRIIVNEYAGEVASKILAGTTPSKNIGSMLRDFVVKEIISKEGVKLPAYGVEEVTNAVVYKMLGLESFDKTSALSPQELSTAMAVTAEAMTYLALAKDSGKMDKLSQKDMVGLLNDHIMKSMKNDEEFNTWLKKNNSTFQQMLNQLVKTDLPKFHGKMQA